MMGNLLVLGGAIALGEMIAKAFGATLIFAVAVQIVDVARRRPSEKPPEKRTCKEHLTECMMSDLAIRRDEDVWGAARCLACKDKCREDKWPATIPVGDQFLSCEYWKRQ